MVSIKGKMTVFMFPWLAHGHMSPFLELAKKLCDRNFVVYLCSSRVNLESVRNEVSGSRYKGLIELVVLNITATKALPANCHTTKNIPSHQMPLLKKAFDSSALHFSVLLRTYKPDFLIYDTIQPWAPVIASIYDIPAVAYISTSTIMTSFMIHHHDSPGTPFPFQKITLHGHEVANFINLTESRENFYKGKSRFVESIRSSSDIVLIKSSVEIEEKYINHLSTQIGKKVICVGSLVEVPKSTDEDEDDLIIQWLDQKEPSSTVFVSFGSEYFLTNEEINEISHGLELSGVNFIWVVRFPEGNNTKIDKILPEFFLENTKGRGLVIQGWAPQVKILKHKNTGGFVSHCGWSSVMEGINLNVPIIAMPMHLDQPLNARLVKEIGVGLEVKRLKNGRLEGEKIARMVRNMVRGKAGQAARVREREMTNKIKESEAKVMDGVVDELAKLWRKKHRVYNEVFWD